MPSASTCRGEERGERDRGDPQRVQTHLDGGRSDERDASDGHDGELVGERVVDGSSGTRRPSWRDGIGGDVWQRNSSVTHARRETDLILTVLSCANIWWYKGEDEELLCRVNDARGIDGEGRRLEQNGGVVAEVL